MPKIYFAAPEGVPFPKVREIIQKAGDRLGIDLVPALSGQDVTAARQISIENCTFMIADVSAEKASTVEMVRVAYEIGYAKRSQKTVILIAQGKSGLPNLGQTGILSYDLQDVDGFTNKLTATLVGLCRKEKIRYHAFPNMPEFKEDTKLPLLAKESCQVENYVALGDEFVDTGLYEQAYQEYGRAILHLGQSQFKSHHAAIYIKRAFTCKRLGMTQDALDDYAQAISLNANYLDAYVARGSLLSELRKYKEALKDFYMASKIKPDYTKMYVFAGSMHRQLREYKEALEQLNKAIQLNPNYHEAFFARGEIFADMSQYDKALEDFSKVIVANFKHIEAHIQRGLVYKAMKHYDKALNDFNQALKLNPNHGEAYTYRGQVLFEKGYAEYYQQAIQDWQKAIELGVPNAQALEDKIRATARKM